MGVSSGAGGGFPAGVYMRGDAEPREAVRRVNSCVATGRLGHIAGQSCTHDPRTDPLGIRRAKVLTQATLCLRAGIATSGLSRVENDRLQATMPALEGIAAPRPSPCRG